MSMKDGNIEDIITKTRLRLLFDNHQFFASLVFHLQPVFVTDEKELKRIWRGQKPTMATDGKRLYYSEEFIRSLDPANGQKQLMGVLAHEGLHFGLGHPFRLGERDPQLFNIAADISINYHVQAAGLMLPPDCVTIKDKKVQELFRPLPPGVSWDEMARDWDVEQIFHQFDRNKTGNKSQMPNWGIVIAPTDGNGDPLDDDQLKELEMSARDAFVNAAASAKMAGNMPGSLEGVIDEMTKPQVDWRAVLQRFISSAVPHDYTWKRPSRRFAHRRMYMPSINKRNFGTIVLFIDTSGSVSDDEQRHFLGEINNLSQMYPFEEIITVPCDYIVQEKGIRRHKRGEVITTLRVDGRGGTSFRPPFEWLDKQDDINPIRVVYFTDMEGDFPDKEYPVPTLWVATTKHKAPWGETVHIDVGR